MSFYGTAEEFLSRVNKEVHLHGQQIRATARDYKRGQGDLIPEVFIGTLVFNRPVDLVIEGCCSTDRDQVLKLNQTYPMGECISRREEREQGLPPRSWLHELLKEYPNAKNVLVFPACCGSYFPKYQEFIRQLFPDREWIFPDMPDLCDNFFCGVERTVEGVQALFNAGILRST